MQNPFIVGDRVYLRPLEVEDTDAFVPWLNDTEIGRYLGLMHPTNRLRERGYMEKLYKDDRKVNMGIVLKEGDQLIGSISLDDISIPHRHAELGILIGDKSCWSKGYGTEAMNLMIEYGFNQLNLHRIYLFVYDFNARAVRAYEKVGFKREGVLRDHGYRNGEYYDNYAMSILEDEWRAKA